MVDYTMRLSQQDLERVNRGMEAVFSRTSWSATQAVAKAGYMLSRSAASFCKPGQRLHQIIDNPNLARRSRFPFAIVKLSPVTGATPTLVEVQTRNTDAARIRNRGFARASWALAMARVNRRKAKLPSYSRGSMRRLLSLVYAGRIGTTHNPGVMIQNRVAYMNTAYPGVVPHAVRAGMTALVATFDKELAKELKQAWA